MANGSPRLPSFLLRLLPIGHIASNHKKLAMEMAAEGVWRFVTVLKVEALTGSKVKEIKNCCCCRFRVIFMICALGQAEIAN